MNAAEFCPRCSSRMYRLYERMQDPQTGKRMYVGVAWRCSSPQCRYISQD